MLKMGAWLDFELMAMWRLIGRWYRKHRFEINSIAKMHNVKCCTLRAAGWPGGFTQRRNSCELQWRALRSRPKRHQSRSSPHHGRRLGNSKEGKLCWNLEIWHHEWVSNAQGYNFKMDRPAILTADESGILQVPGNEWAVFKLGHAGAIKKVRHEN